MTTKLQETTCCHLYRSTCCLLILSVEVKQVECQRISNTTCHRGRIHETFSVVDNKLDYTTNSIKYRTKDETSKVHQDLGTIHQEFAKFTDQLKDHAHGLFDLLDDRTQRHLNEVEEHTKVSLDRSEDRLHDWT